MPKSSSGDLYWIENQYVMVKMCLKKVTENEFSPHNDRILWALKKPFGIDVKSAEIHEFPGSPDLGP